ncbi:MAG: 30S ribosomal protein S4e [Thermoprotei archaeon]|nr:MAG: 30S ribosomal protein S4e [Thermoprotei archaeon]RLF03566.1 MAG: 30S ribosomal protein S4e [Thermoprotei archaeon]
MRKVKGSLRHLRREVAPPYWPIHKKEFVWTIKPSPGPHPLHRCIPLAIILRDILGYAKTLREARRIIGRGVIKVDGRVRRDYKYPVGLMDVLEITETEEYYRIVSHPYRILYPVPIDPSEAKYKLCRIEGKTAVKHGHIQLHFHDGRNHIIRVNNPMEPVEDVYKTFDSVLIKIPKQEIIEHIKFEEGVLGLVIDGRNAGRLGKVLSITQVFRKREAIVTLKDEEGEEEFRTILEYVFPVGRDKPLITVKAS